MKYAQGACQCQKIKFKVALPPFWAGHCHCHQCQQIHGAAFVTWVGFSGKDFKLIDPQKQFKTYNSGKAERGFCQNCGSSFYFRYAAKKKSQDIYLTRTSIKTKLELKPSEHIYYDSHVDWIKITDQLPKK